MTVRQTDRQTDRQTEEEFWAKIQLKGFAYAIYTICH
jgi:hypothetical protein